MSFLGILDQLKHWYSVANHVYIHFSFRITLLLILYKFYDSVEKLQFSFFHPVSLCNKRIGFVCNGCEASLSSSKNFVQNSDQFKKKKVFLSKKIQYSISLNVSKWKSLKSYKSLKIFLWASSITIDIKLDHFDSTRFGS